MNMVMEGVTGLTFDEEDLSQASRSTFDLPYKPEKNVFSHSGYSEDDEHQDKSEDSVPGSGWTQPTLCSVSAASRWTGNDGS